MHDIFCSPTTFSHFFHVKDYGSRKKIPHRLLALSFWNVLIVLSRSSLKQANWTTFVLGSTRNRKNKAHWELKNMKIYFKNTVHGHFDIKNRQQQLLLMFTLHRSNYNWMPVLAASELKNSYNTRVKKKLVRRLCACLMILDEWTKQFQLFSSRLGVISISIRAYSNSAAPSRRSIRNTNSYWALSHLSPCLCRSIAYQKTQFVSPTDKKWTWAKEHELDEPERKWIKKHFHYVKHFSIPLAQHLHLSTTLKPHTDISSVVGVFSKSFKACHLSFDIFFHIIIVTICCSYSPSLKSIWKGGKWG